MKEAQYQGRAITPQEGLDLKSSTGEVPDFRCVECGGAARVHQAGGRNPAHFEHLESKEGCSLVNQAWRRRKHR